MAETMELYRPAAGASAGIVASKPKSADFIDPKTGALNLAEGETGRIKIFDLRGSIVMDVRNVNASTKIDIGRLVSAGYMVQFRNDLTKEVKVQEIKI